MVANTNIRYLHTLIVIVIFASTAYAIKCYRCNSELDTECRDSFSATNIQKLDCSDSIPIFMSPYFKNFRATGCSKRIVHIAGRDPITVRSCFFGDLNDKQNGCVKDILWPFYHHVPYENQMCDVCTTDLCNSSTFAKPFFGTIALIFAFTRLAL